ncbi:MAG: hypothetical protein HOW73_49170 [Polyangiaceae bacterium]|nr:hypothetical protein [Polyangiaceae bacterium]
MKTTLSFALCAVFAVACAAGSDDETNPTSSGGSGSGGEAGGPSSDGGSGAGFQEGGGGEGGSGYVPKPEVFGHSKSTLYKLNPETKDVGIVAPFNGCGDDIVDLAIDAESHIFAATDTALFRIDAESAACTKVADGSYPNSLSFVPAGTLDPNEEALVGFLDDQYVRIDVETGDVTEIGSPWNNTYVSSGDVVSVKNGPTYLTIKDADPDTMDCGDCLVEINPTTGAIVKEYGDIGYDRVFGAAFWAGSVYGFTNGGDIFEMVIENNQLTTHTIATPQGLSFWGAGSTTSAPPIPR